MIVIGGGAVDASAELLELAAMLQAPVVAFRGGRGVISDRHYLSQVLPAGYELWKTADVVLGIGTRMEQQLLHWKTRRGSKSSASTSMRTNSIASSAPAVAIHGDAREAIVALSAALRRTTLQVASREDELVALKARVAARDQPGAAAARVPAGDPPRVFPTTATSSTRSRRSATRRGTAFPTYAPRHHVNCGYQGTLGYGYATALGVKVAHPDKCGRQHRGRRRLPVHVERNGDRRAVRHRARHGAVQQRQVPERPAPAAANGSADA